MLLIFLMLVILGRFLTLEGEIWLERHFSIDIPRHLQDKTMLPSGRTDLICHDIYSLFCGFVFCAIIYFPLRWLYHSIYVSPFRLPRQNALRRSNSAGGSNLRGYVGILESEEAETQLTIVEKIRLGLITWYLVTGRKYLNKVCSSLLSR